MTKIFSSLVFFGGLVTLLAGCSTPSSFYTPASRMQSPTVSGRTWGGSIGGIASPSVRIDTVRNIDATPPDSSGADVGVPDNPLGLFSIIGLKADLGFSSFFDAFYENGSLGGRVQFLGDQSHGFVGTLSAASDGFITAESDTTAASTKDKTEASALDVGISLGYAAGSGSVPYVSYGHRKIWSTTTIDQTANSYEYHRSGTQDIFAIGYQLNSGHFGFQIEAGENITYWPNVTSYEDGFAAVALTYRWGTDSASN